MPVNEGGCSVNAMSWLCCPTGLASTHQYTAGLCSAFAVHRLSAHVTQVQVLEGSNALKLADEHVASEPAAAGAPAPSASVAPPAPVKIITPIGQLTP